MPLRCIVLLCALVACGAPPPAANAPVRLTGDVRFRDGVPVLELVAHGSGETAEVTPTIIYQHRTWSADAATIPPGSRHAWSLPLPPPDDPGTFPVTIRAEYRVGSRSAVAPLVLVLATPGAAGTPVRAGLVTTPITTFGRGELTLENGEDRPIAGRVSYVLPSGLRTDPESTPAQMASGGRAVVPLLIENRDGQTPSGESLYAVYEYAAEGSHYTVVASAPLAIAARGGDSVPLIIGVAALAAALGIAILASRRANAP